MAFNCSTLSQHFCSNHKNVTYIKLEETSVDISQVILIKEQLVFYR